MSFKKSILILTPGSAMFLNGIPTTTTHLTSLSEKSKPSLSFPRDTAKKTAPLDSSELILLNSLRAAVPLRFDLDYLSARSFIVKTW